jgi:outer membrane protein assembly factor BamD (BamD/ComL family)
MKIKIFLYLSVSLFLSLTTLPLQGAYTLKNGKLLDVKEAPTMSAQDHFAAGAQAYEAECWQEATQHFSIVTLNYPTSTYGQEAFYFLGVSLYFQEEYDFANDAFSNYLNVQANPKYFQSTLEFKFAIAEQFNAGAKRRLLGTKKLPKWACGISKSLEIYDEVIAAMPCSDLAAQALIAKGCLNWRLQTYRSAVESFQMVIRRFPKYEKTPDCYLYIGKVFLEQSRYEFQNSDILAFAQLNLRKFERDFPREERLCEAQEDVMAIQEVYANGLYQTGLFYERTCKPQAALIYYYDAIRQFPNTCVAEQCRARVRRVNPSYCEESTSAETCEVEEPSDREESIDS